MSSANEDFFEAKTFELTWKDTKLIFSGLEILEKGAQEYNKQNQSEPPIFKLMLKDIKDLREKILSNVSAREESK